jgi:hypothetical protein
MPLNTYTQKSTETKNYSVNYSAWLDTAEELALATITIADNTTIPLVVNHTVDAANDLINLTVSGGEDANQYEVSVRVTTTLLQVKDDCIVFYVEDDC